MTKQVTMTVGRPLKKDKKKNVTVRIYDKDQELIQKYYQTAQKFIDIHLNNLRCKELNIKKKIDTKS